MLRVDIVTLFPGMFQSLLSHSIIKRGIEAKKLKVNLVNLRDFAKDRHKTCDDRPFGGGPGMVMMVEPIDKAMKKLHRNCSPGEIPVILMTPHGKMHSQQSAAEWSQKKRLIILCGHYEGIDQRVVEKWVTHEVSVGDFILTGGELAAMTVLDSVCRLLPGVLGNAESAQTESFDGSLLEYPQYTRPAEYDGVEVPEVLLSGDHARIEAWRLKQSEKITRQKRPDMYRKYCELRKRGH